MLILPNDAIAMPKFQTNIGVLSSLRPDSTGDSSYYLNVGIGIIPQLYVGPYFALLTHPLDTHNNLKGSTFGLSALYELNDWFFLGTFAPFGSTKKVVRGRETDTSIDLPLTISIGVGFLVIPYFGLSLSQVWRTYGNDEATRESSSSLRVGCVGKINF